MFRRLRCQLCEWKLIPLKYIQKAFDNDFKFHSNLHVPSCLFCNFPSFYKNKLNFWSNSYSFPPTVPSGISPQYLWFNTFIKIENKVVYYKDFSNNQINYVSNFFDRNRRLKSWLNIMQEHNIK